MKTIKEVLPQAVPAPFLVLGMTDARHYTAISDSVCRFCPLYVGTEDRERVSLDNFDEFIKFYIRMIRNLQ